MSHGGTSEFPASAGIDVERQIAELEIYVGDMTGKDTKEEFNEIEYIQTLVKLAELYGKLGRTNHGRRYLIKAVERSNSNDNWLINNSLEVYIL